MPSKPILKSRKVDALVEWFGELATDWDKLLPPCYRYTGTLPTDDRRAAAWARADQHMVLAASALSELQAVLRSRLTTSTVNRGGGKGYTVISKPQGSIAK